MTLIDVISAVALILTLTIDLPQIYKIFRVKRVEAISLTSLVMKFFMMIVWLSYGIFKPDNLLIVTSAFSFLQMLTFLILYFTYKKRETNDI